jgi:hypothetical protein
MSIKLYLKKVLALYFSNNLFYSKVSFIINFSRPVTGTKKNLGFWVGFGFRKPKPKNPKNLKPKPKKKIAFLMD